MREVREVNEDDEVTDDAKIEIRASKLTNFKRYASRDKKTLEIRASELTNFQRQLITSFFPHLFMIFSGLIDSFKQCMLSASTIIKFK